MRYAYSDLGEQEAGKSVVVRWQGSMVKVLLLDPVNFRKYVERWPFICHVGGRYRRPPARLSIPQDGHWYVVVDLGARVTDIAPTVEVLEADEEAAASTNGVAETNLAMPVHS